MIGGHQFSNLSYGFGSIVNGVGYAKDKFYSDASLIGNSVNSFFYTPTPPNSEDSYIPPIRPYNQSFLRTAAESLGYSTPQYEYDYSWQQNAFDSLADKSSTGLGLGIGTVGGFVAANALFSTIPIFKMSKYGATKGANLFGAQYRNKDLKNFKDWFKFKTEASRGISRIAGDLTYKIGKSISPSMSANVARGIGVTAVGLAGTTLGAVGGLLPGFAAMTAADKYFDSFFDVIKDRNQIGNYIANNSHRFVSGKAGETFLPGGFTRTEGENIADFMEGLANKSTVFNMGDFKGVLSKGVEIGTFRGTKDVEDFKKKFKDLTSTLKILTTSLKQTLDQGLDTIKQLNSLGIKSTTDQVKFLTQVESKALASGKTAQEVFNAGIIGAQIFKGSGIHLSAGALANQFNYSNIASLHRNGGLTSQDIEQAGGENALSQQMTARSLGMLRTPLGKTFLLGMSSDGSFDKAKLDQFISGKTDIFKMGYDAVSQANTPYKILNFESKQNEIISKLHTSYQGAGGEFSKFLVGFARAKATAQATGINADPETLRTIMTAQFKQSGVSDSEIKAMFGMLDYSDEKYQDQQIALRKQIQNKFVEDFDQKYSLTAKLKLTKNKLKEVFISHPAEDVGRKLSSTRESLKKWWNKKAYGIYDDNEFNLSNTDLVSTIEDELNLFRSRSISELSSENIENVLNRSLKLDKKDYAGINKHNIINKISKNDTFKNSIEKLKKNNLSIVEREDILSNLKENLYKNEFDNFIKDNPNLKNKIDEAISITSSELSQITSSSGKFKLKSKNKEIEENLKVEQSKMLSSKEKQLQSLFSNENTKNHINSRYKNLNFENKILENAYGKYLDRNDVKENLKVLSSIEASSNEKEISKQKLLKSYEKFQRENTIYNLDPSLLNEGFSTLKKNLESNFYTNYKENAESIKKFKSDMTEVPWLGKKTSAQALENTVRKGIIKLNKNDYDYNINQELNDRYVTFPRGLRIKKTALNELSKKMNFRLQKSFLEENDKNITNIINNDSSLIEGISNLIKGKNKSIDYFINNSLSSSSNFKKYLSKEGSEKLNKSLDNKINEEFNLSDLNELGQKILVKSFQSGGRTNEIEEYIDSANLMSSGKYGTISELNKKISSTNKEKEDLIDKSYSELFHMKKGHSSNEVVNAHNFNQDNYLKKLKNNKEFTSIFDEFISNEYNEKELELVKVKLSSVINTDKSLSTLEKKSLTESLFFNLKDGDPLKKIRDNVIDKKSELNDLLKEKQSLTMDLLTDTSEKNLNDALKNAQLLSQDEKDGAISIFKKLKGNDYFTKTDYDNLNNLREKDLVFKNATDNLNDSIKTKLAFDNFENRFIKRDKDGRVINNENDLTDSFLNIIKDNDFSTFKKITQNADVRDLFNKKVLSDSGRKEIENNIIRNLANYGSKNETQINSTLNNFADITPDILSAMKKTLSEMHEMYHALNVMKKQLNIQYK